MYRRVSAVFIWTYVKRLFSARDAAAQKESLGYVSGGYRTVFARLVERIRSKIKLGEFSMAEFFPTAGEQGEEWFHFWTRLMSKASCRPSPMASPRRVRRRTRHVRTPSP